MSGDILDQLWERLTGFAPYTPVTVSGKTTPKPKPPCPSENELIDPYGSGPVPIEPVTVKTPSRTVDGVKTGLVVGR